MIEIPVDALAHYPKAHLTPEKQNAIRAALTVVPRPGPLIAGVREERPPIVLYDETLTHLLLPRGYFQRHRDARHVVVPRWAEPPPLPSPLVFEGQLDSSQQEALDTVAGLLEGGSLGHLIEAATGWGKTVYACALMARLGVPALIGVHKEFLVDQWVKRISRFLPGAVVGRVQGDTCRYKGCHVTVGMLQSLASHEYKPEFYRAFGLLMLDEVHRASAPAWNPVFRRFPVRWVTGLSGTMRRGDGTEQVFFDSVGDIAFSCKKARLTPTLYYLYSKMRLPERMNPRLVSRPTLLKLVTGNRPRNTMIVDAITRAADKDRNILVVSERLEHLAALEAAFRKGSPDVSTSFYVGGKSEGELDEASAARVIFATLQLVAEGLDIPRLDTVVLTTPLSDPEQVVGRILRPCPGKKTPVVVDVRDDGVLPLKRSAESRDELYASAGWK